MHKVKILIANSNYYNKQDLEKIKKIKHFKVTIKNFKIYKNFIEFIKQAGNFDVIFTTIGFTITDTILNKYQKMCHTIITPTTGLSHIKVINKKIEVISLNNIKKKISTVNSTAELTFGLIIVLMRKIYNSINHVKKDNWNRNLFFGYDLKNKTIGIIGMGRIGKKIRKYAKSFEMKVISCDTKNVDLTLYNRKLKHLLKNSDIVTLHIPEKNNKNFFGLKKFKLMKKKSYFINTSRGEIVIERDLIYSLKKKLIAGAALDVLNGDSSFNIKKNENKLLFLSRKNSNVLITPHIGGASNDAKKYISEILIKKTISYLKKKYVY